MIGSLAALSLLVLASNELDFFYIDRMPPLAGDLVHAETRTDAASGLTYDRSIFEFETDRYLVRSHRIFLMCFYDGSLSIQPHIVAVQYIAREASAYQDAETLNNFAEVFVVDERGRIRVYENLTPQEMAELTRRFQPYCERI